jgi:hypothetical protein
MKKTVLRNCPLKTTFMRKYANVFHLERGAVPHTVKKVTEVPVPRRDVTYQTLPGRE